MDRTLTAPAAVDPALADVDPRALLVGRMPLFASAWLVSAAAWSVALVIDGGVAVRAVAVAFVAEVGVLVAMWAAMRRTPTADGALRVAVGGCVVLGWSVLALFVSTHGLREVLGVKLLTLYTVPAFTFAWGWRAERLLVGLTLPCRRSRRCPWLAPSEPPDGAPHGGRVRDRSSRSPSPS